MRLLIYGSRAYARTVAELAEDCGHEVVGMIDDDDPRRPGVIGGFADARAGHANCGVAMGIGYSDLAGRWQAWRRVRDSGMIAPALIHPRAIVARSASIGQGVVVMAGSIVDQRVRIGEAVVIWPGACISHDSVVGDNSFVSPNATLCGEVRVGANSFIGAGAAIADHCEIPADSRILMLERYAGHRRA